MDTFYVSSSATNCLLTSLDIENILSSDLSPDNGWNIYEKTESCNDNGGGGGDGGGGVIGNGKNTILRKF